MRSGALFMVEC